MIPAFEPSYPAGAALVFLVVMGPVWLYMAWVDMARLKITNGLVLFVFGVFVVLGPFLMPLDVYLWQVAQAAVMLAVMFALYSMGTMGGGDAKFIAAAAPYFMVADFAFVMVLFLACVLAAVAVHRLARALGVDRAVPLWASWTSGRRFPLGLALGGVVTIYLGLAAF
ncbi:MAG: prepilin peptidase [Pseudomonadota bacterium]